MEDVTVIAPRQCDTVEDVRELLTMADCSKSVAVPILSPELARVVGRCLDQEKVEARCRDHLAKAERYRREVRRKARIAWSISIAALVIAIATNAGAI